MKTSTFNLAFIFMVFLTLTCMGTALSAQSKMNIVKLDLIDPFLLTFTGSYERFLSDERFSVQVSASYTQRNTTIWEDLHPKFSGFGAEIQARYYASMSQRSTSKGLYLGAFGSYSQYDMNLALTDGIVNFLDGNSKFFGIAAGYQGDFKSSLFIDLTLGAGYHIADYSGRFSERGRVIPSVISNGILPKLDFKIGWGF